MSMSQSRSVCIFRGKDESDLWAHALALLETYSKYLNPVEVLHMLPDDLPLQSVLPFLRKVCGYLSPLCFFVLIL